MDEPEFMVYLESQLLRTFSTNNFDSLSQHISKRHHRATAIGRLVTHPRISRVRWISRDITQQLPGEANAAVPDLFSRLEEASISTMSALRCHRNWGDQLMSLNVHCASIPLINRMRISQRVLYKRNTSPKLIRSSNFGSLALFMDKFYNDGDRSNYETNINYLFGQIIRSRRFRATNESQIRFIFRPLMQTICDKPFRRF